MFISGCAQKSFENLECNFFLVFLNQWSPSPGRGLIGTWPRNYTIYTGGDTLHSYSGYVIGRFFPWKQCCVRRVRVLEQSSLSGRTNMQQPFVMVQTDNFIFS